MEAILEEISNFISKGLSFLGLVGTEDMVFEAVLGEATQVVMQIIATILLFVFIRLFVWKKIVHILDERQKNIEKNIKDAEELRNLSLEEKKLTEAEYQKAKSMARDIIASAEQEGKEAKNEIIQAAKDEAKRRMGILDQELQLEIDESKKNMKNAIADIAFLVAEKIVKREIDKKEYEKVVDDFIEEVGK